MSNNKNLSAFTNKARTQIGEVIGSEQYAVHIANTLGHESFLKSLGKFIKPEKVIKNITRGVKGVNIEPLANHFRGSDEIVDKNPRLEAETER